MIHNTKELRVNHISYPNLHNIIFIGLVLVYSFFYLMWYSIQVIQQEFVIIYFYLFVSVKQLCSLLKHRTYDDSKPLIFFILMIRRTRWHAFQLDWSKLIFRCLYMNRPFLIQNGSHMHCKGEKWRQLDSGREGFDEDAK